MHSRYINCVPKISVFRITNRYLIDNTHYQYDTINTQNNNTHKHIKKKIILFL